jgi:hypothetical protein
MIEEKIGNGKIQHSAQPNENSIDRQTSKNRFRQLLASRFSLQAGKENKTMTNEENRPDNTQQPPLNSPSPEEKKLSPAAGAAILQFLSIKEALTGPSPDDCDKARKAWVLPEVDFRAEKKDRP